jgi:hypothetical protein
MKAGGLSLTGDPTTAEIHLDKNGTPIAMLTVAPVTVRWADTSLSMLLESIFEYSDKLAWGDGDGELQIEPLLIKATRARCRIERRDSLTTKDYFVSHPAFGGSVRFNVLRGQTHVVEVVASDPDAFVPLRQLATMGALIG